MNAVVGSKNPVKIAASREVLRRVYGDDIHVAALAVSSGVSVQPWGDEETLRGARNRAQAALQRDGAALGIGLEGGLVEVEGCIFTCAWCAVARSDGATGVAGGANLLLPTAVADAVRGGAELGPTMDAVTGLENTKQHQGAIGILTQGYLDRQSAYEHILTLALARLLSPGHYADRAGD
jgi:inosine/xanthosine triphosphatase